MIKDTMFVIAVPDLEKSSKFYSDVLGFEISEIGDPGWRMYKKDGCHIMAGYCPDALPSAELGDHSYFCYLIVDDIDDYYKIISSTDVEIQKHLKEEPWGMREFALRTIDGHRIMVGERIE